MEVWLAIVDYGDVVGVHLTREAALKRVIEKCKSGHGRLLSNPSPADHGNGYSCGVERWDVE